MEQPREIRVNSPRAEQALEVVHVSTVPRQDGNCRCLHARRRATAYAAAVRLAIVVLLLAGCVTVTKSTMSPASSKLECLDCDKRVAVGLPIRVISSWVGSCTSEGYQAFFETEHDTENIVWRRHPFSKTKACDEHHYKLVVKCSRKCVIRAIDSPDTSTIKLLGIYPETSGPFRFSLEIRASKDSEAIAKLDSPELLVRAPDEISAFEKERPIDGESLEASFDGVEYFLSPGTARAGKPPDRGTKYKPATVEPPPEGADVAPPERLQRDCKARTPGATTWRPCTQGIAAGDDVRIDVTAWLANARLVGDVSLVEQEGDATVPWTCYRSTFAVPGAQICVRYGVPAGEHALTWRGTDYEIADSLVVGGGS